MLLGVGVVFLSYGVWVGRAPSVVAPRGDAVVVHAGGRGERLDHALELMDQGAAPTLVIMFGESRGFRRAYSLCGRTEPFEVICPRPELETTIGEAMMIGELAEGREWTSIVAVTTDYHLRRAAYLDRKCGGVEVSGSAPGSGLGRLSQSRRISKEMLGMVQALLTRC